MNGIAKVGIAVLMAVVMGVPLGCKPAANSQTPPATTTPAAVSEKPVETTDLEGTYNLVTVDATVVSGTLTLNGDGTFVSAMNYNDPSGGTKSSSFSGTYVKEGSDIVLTGEDGSSAKVKVEGNTLTTDAGGVVSVYQK